DFFAETEFLDIVNAAYSEILKTSRFVAIDKKDLTAFRAKNKHLIRIVPLLETYWKEHENWGSFDKMEICRRLCERTSEDPAFLNEKTIARFETLFQNIHVRLNGEPGGNPQRTAASAAGAASGDKVDGDPEGAKKRKQ